MRSSLAAVAVIAAVAGCGPSSLTILGPNPASIAVQPADVPSTLQKCPGSGSMDTFLNAIKAQDQAKYASTKQQWDQAKKDGATSAEVVFYTDSKAHCDSIMKSASPTITPGPYPLVINFVLQFKDEPSATKGYTSDTIFGFDQATLKGVGTGLSQGKGTGLGPNSTAISAAFGGVSFYIAVWQNKAFMVILAIINLAPATGSKIALKVNGRIH